MSILLWAYCFVSLCSMYIAGIGCCVQVWHTTMIYPTGANTKQVGHDLNVRIWWLIFVVYASCVDVRSLHIAFVLLKMSKCWIATHSWPAACVFCALMVSYVYRKPVFSTNQSPMRSQAKQICGTWSYIDPLIMSFSSTSYMCGTTTRMRRPCKGRADSLWIVMHTRLYK